MIKIYIIDVLKKIANHKYSFIVQLMFIVLFLEKLYMPSTFATGSYNRYILPCMITGLGVIFIYQYKNQKPNLKIYVMIGTIILIIYSYFLIGGSLYESFRYILIVILVFLAGNIKIPSLLIFSRLIIIAGFLFVLIESKKDVMRSTGFLNSSPTLFSITILTAIAYISYHSETLLDFFINILGFVLIAFSKSRSTLVLASMFILLKTIVLIVSKKNKSIYLLLTTSMIIITLFIMIGNNFIKYDVDESASMGSALLRTDADESSSTRQYFLNIAIDYIKDKPSILLTGAGAGTSYRLITNAIGYKTPLHFDLFTILIDFGALGIIIMFLYPIMVIKNWSWQGWVLLLLGSIHNILYFPTGLLYIILVSRTLEPSKMTQCQLTQNLKI